MMSVLQKTYIPTKHYERSYIPNGGENPVATPEFGAYLKIRCSAWHEKLKKDPNAQPDDGGITFDEFMDRINDPKIDKIEYARSMPNKFLNQAMQEINKYGNDNFVKKELDTINKAYLNGLVRPDGSLIRQYETFTPYYREVKPMDV
ncbi:MAG: hypothetical protein Q8942_17630 [Bacillota bacterium]|nr:hypothetical protein [Bacillota bacterium]